MKRRHTFSLALGFALGCAPCAWALVVTVVSIRDDVGDGPVKGKLSRQLAKTQSNLLTGRTRELRNLERDFVGRPLSAIEAWLGPAGVLPPGAFALPIAQPDSVAFRLDGGRRIDQGNLFVGLRQRATFLLGDCAAAQVFHDNDGQKKVRKVVFYLPIDEAFLELREWGDLKARLKWDDEKVETLKVWLDEHPTESRPAVEAPTSTLKPDAIP